MRKLGLAWNCLGPAGAAALARGCWPALAELDLSGNNLGAEGAAAVTGAHMPKLQSLGLESNYLGPIGAANLKLAWPGLQTLYINELGAEGAAALAEVRLPMLNKLYCDFNNFGVLGATALTAAAWDRLQELDLRLIDIGDEGAAALTARWPGLKLPPQHAAAGLPWILL